MKLRGPRRDKSNEFGAVLLDDCVRRSAVVYHFLRFVAFERVNRYNATPLRAGHRGSILPPSRRNS